MEFKRIESIIEAVLFAAGEEVANETLCNILELDKSTFTNVMNNLMKKYDSENRGLQIIQIENSYQICTRHEYFEYVRMLCQPKFKNELSQAALETLSIVAYKQPVTRAVIEQIRGVGCDTSLSRLLEKNFIKEVGRMDAPGKPILYGTTDEFLRSFGFKTLQDLPEIEILNQIEIEK